MHILLVPLVLSLFLVQDQVVDEDDEVEFVLPKDSETDLPLKTPCDALKISSQTDGSILDPDEDLLAFFAARRQLFFKYLFVSSKFVNLSQILLDLFSLDFYILFRQIVH